MSPTTGVVVLNFGDGADTLACLDSLERSHDLDLDVAVVDNGPEDQHHRRLRRAVGMRAATIATGANLGYAAGNNLGIEWLLDRGCHLVWILNSDTLVEPSTLPRLRQCLEAVPDCGIVGPRILYAAAGPPRIWFDGGVVDAATAVTSHLHMGALPHGRPVDTVDVDYVTGASMLVRRSMIEDIGPIPEHYFLYLEEVDWCRRAQRAGWRTLVHRSSQMSHHRRSSGALPQPYYVYYMTRNRYLFAEECLGIDGEHALAELDRVFLTPWRARIDLLAPEWVGTFDRLVDLATSDARAGVVGRRDEVDLVPRPGMGRTA